MKIDRSCLSNHIMCIIVLLYRLSPPALLIMRIMQVGCFTLALTISRYFGKPVRPTRDLLIGRLHCSGSLDTAVI